MRRIRTVREIGDIMQWSPRCREHFFPWVTTAEEVMRAHSIAEAGITECHPGYHLERSAPRFHLLIYPTKGAGEVYDTTRSRRLEPGQLLIAPALGPFGYQPLTRTWSFMWFHLPDEETWSFLRKETLTVRKTQLSDALYRATEGFLEESRGWTESHREASGCYISLIDIFIKRELGTGDASAHVDTENRLDHLCALVNADLARDWNVKSLAEAAGVSCPHLHHIIRERFGISPMKLVTRLRMERAQEWLIIYDAPQRVIGEMVGYQNEFAFLVAFKRFAGVTPKEFRKWR